MDKKESLAHYLEKLLSEGRHYFTIVELERNLEMNKNTLAVSLSRLSKKGRLKMVRRGFGVLFDFGGIEPHPSYYIEAMGAKVLYHEASVFQDRNVHDLIRDMKMEYIGYENNLQLVSALVSNPNLILDYLPERSRLAFELYQKHFK